MNITQIQQAVATIHISTSRKPVVLYFGSFTNSESLLKQLLMICGLKSLTVPAPISAFTHEETPAISDYKESTAGVREALYRKLS